MRHHISSACGLDPYPNQIRLYLSPSPSAFGSRVFCGSMARPKKYFTEEERKAGIAERARQRYDLCALHHALLTHFHSQPSHRKREEICTYRRELYQKKKSLEAPRIRLRTKRVLSDEERKTLNKKKSKASYQRLENLLCTSQKLTFLHPAEGREPFDREGVFLERTGRTLRLGAQQISSN